jgi:hypothetical protein
LSKRIKIADFILNITKHCNKTFKLVGYLVQAYFENIRMIIQRTSTSIAFMTTTYTTLMVPNTPMALLKMLAQLDDIYQMKKIGINLKII